MFARLCVVALVACGDPMILLVTRPSTPMLFVLQGHSQPLGLATEAWITEATYGDLSVAYPAVQIVNHNSAAAGIPINFHDEGPGALAPRALAVSDFPPDTFGPEVTLGRRLNAAYPGRIHGAKMCVSGSKFVDHWDDLAYLVNPFITFVQDAMDDAGVTDPNNVVVFGINGYNDAAAGVTEANYRAALDDFYGRTRLAIGAHWIILDRLATSYDAAGHVRAAQTSFAGAASKVGLVDSDDLTTRVGVGEAGDNHWSSNSVAEWGVRGAAKFVEIYTP